MWLQISKTEPAIHPSEVIATINTTVGEEMIIIDKDSVFDSLLEVGEPIANGGDSVLIELPRETMKGLWRIRVPKDALSPSRSEAATA
ncbi:hypothetical protein [Pontixanthobacter sp.]|uniref:hypothetical protein n=1 Tax=Pontixanthobacter sp. TaxID=2792078 RepID=UPI003C7CF7C8